MYKIDALPLSYGSKKLRVGSLPLNDGSVVELYQLILVVVQFGRRGGERMAKAIGKVHHYYDKIGVAALVLMGPLVVGDTVKISGHGQELTQTISSMQIEHEQVSKAKKGDDVAIKVDSAVKEGDVVEKV